MFSGASNVAIAGGTFINQTNKTQTTVHTSAFDKLTVAAAHSALYDAPARTNKTRCHQYSRTNVLDYLERWAQGICDEGASVLWLHGGAGAGKSAIMQTLAERCAAQKLALGSFFFFRSDPTRNTAEVLIPTLVYQLVQLFPSALQILNQIVNADPLIFKKSFQVQILHLFVPALQHLVQLGSISNAPQSPRLLLIDGLDECDNAAQQHAIIRAVVEMCHEHHIPIKFLIASRPEQAISMSFEWFSRENHVLGAISLSEDADVQKDIRRFIEDEFLKIGLQHPFRKMIPLEWPTIDDINSLVRKSSCHFIYAATAMKYIWSAKEDPVRSLQVVLGLEVSRTISPFSELDALYHHTLGSAAHRDKVLQILAHCVQTDSLSSTDIVCFMIKCSKNDLFVYIADVSSLVAIREVNYVAEGTRERVTVLHTSLGDFLRDQSRSGSLYINQEVFHASKLERYLQLFDACSQPQITTPDFPLDLDADRTDGHFPQLIDVIIGTIQISGHLLATEEVLGRYSLRDFHQCQLRFQKNYGIDGSMSMENRCVNLFHFLQTLYWMKTPNASRLFKSCAEDFFDILEEYANLANMKTPLAHAILPLVFSGYPIQIVRRIFCRHFNWNEPLFHLMSPFIRNSRSSFEIMTAMGIIANADPASPHRSTVTSLERLAMAAEAILEYLIDQDNQQFLSTYSRHKSWLQKTKPGKHVTTGAPRLASVFHTLCLSKLRRLEDLDCRILPVPVRRKPVLLTLLSTHETLSIVLGPKYGLISDRLSLRLRIVSRVVDIIDALLWLLPKAGFSEKIVRYSKRAFPWKLYQRIPGLCHQVHQCLDEYNTRVHAEKLEELGQRIENGDVNALMEKSRMFYLDAQD